MKYPLGYIINQGDEEGITRSGENRKYDYEDGEANDEITKNIRKEEVEMHQ